MRPRRLVLSAPLLALLVLALSLPGLAQEGQDRLPIVDRAIEHHGGERYEAMEARFRIVSKSGAFDVEERRDGGLYRTVVVDRTDEGERRIEVTNERVRLTVDGGERPVEAVEEQRLRDFASARIYFPFLPYRLNDPSVRKRDLGLETWGERELHKVKVTFETGSSTDAEDEYLYWFDPDTGRLEQLAYSFGEGERAGLRFRRLVDHRRVGGILFADHENFGIDGTELPVDAVTPELVRERMEPISVVRIEAIEVVPLGDGAEEG